MSRTQGLPVIIDQVGRPFNVDEADAISRRHRSNGLLPTPGSTRTVGPAGVVAQPATRATTSPSTIHDDLIATSYYPVGGAGTTNLHLPGHCGTWG
jgi:hypothetical protein